MGIGFGVTLTGDWLKASNILKTGPRRVTAAIDRALLVEAQFIRTKIVRGIRSQAPGGKQFKPLEAETIRKKGSSKALIDSGTLRNSITTKKTSRGVFVGVLRTSRSADGTNLANVAAVHEFGSVKVGVPARPFMQPIEDKFGPDAPKRMAIYMAKLLLGDFGRIPGAVAGVGSFLSSLLGGMPARSGPARDPATGRFLRRGGD